LTKLTNAFANEFLKSTPLNVASELLDKIQELALSRELPLLSKSSRSCELLDKIRESELLDFIQELTDTLDFCLIHTNEYARACERARKRARERARERACARQREYVCLSKRFNLIHMSM